MNWKKIIIYIGILFLATFAVSFPFGFIQGFFRITEGKALIWISLGQSIAVLIASIWVFAHLSINLKEKAFSHALCVGIGAWLISFPINVLLLGQPITIWMAGIIVILFTLFIGVLIGKVIKNKKHLTTSSSGPFGSL